MDKSDCSKKASIKFASRKLIKTCGMLFLAVFSQKNPSYIRAQNYEKNENWVGIGVSPDKLDFGLVKEDQEYLSGYATVYNGGDYDLTVKTSVTDFEIGKNAPMMDWIEIPEKFMEFELPKNGTQKVVYKIKIPKESTPGSHSATISFSGTPKKEKREMIERTVGVSQRLFLIYPGSDLKYDTSVNKFLVRTEEIQKKDNEAEDNEDRKVEFLGNLKETPIVLIKDKFPFFYLEKKRNLLSLDIELENKGNVYLYPTMTIWIEDASGKKQKIENKSPEELFTKVYKEDKSLVYFFGRILNPGQVVKIDDIKIELEEEWIAGKYKIFGKFDWDNIPKNYPENSEYELIENKDSVTMSKIVSLEFESYPKQFFLFASIPIIIILILAFLLRKRIKKAIKSFISG